MIAADYRDRLSCPACGSPVRRIGRWRRETGRWEFIPESLSIRKPRPEPPERDPDRWTNFPTRKPEADKRTGVVSFRKVDEWHYIVHFECMGSVFSDSDCNGLWQRADCKPYSGEEHVWMQAPDGALEAHAHFGEMVGALVDNQSRAAGER